MKSFLVQHKFLIGIFVALSTTLYINLTDTNTDKVVVSSPADLLKNSQAPMPEFISLREPASVENKEPDSLRADIFCQNQSLKKNTSKQLVMLNLKLCVDIKSNRHIWIKNESNGFKAQLFKIDPKNYRTDFIQLSAGENILKIETILKDGQKIVQTLEILSGS